MVFVVCEVLLVVLVVDLPSLDRQHATTTMKKNISNIQSIIVFHLYSYCNVDVYIVFCFHLHLAFDFIRICWEVIVAANFG